MISLDEARAYVLERVNALESITQRLDQALGHVLAEDVVAGERVPPFANTAMDGFAVQAADTAGGSASLNVVGTVAAGAVFDGEVGPGEAARIMTGAPMPAGADAVVMVEATRLDETTNQVEINMEVSSGMHVRGAGEDVEVGDLLFEAGTLLTGPVLGVLASVGVQSVSVIRRPTVGVMSTGDELVTADRPLEPGEIRESNRITLLAAVASAGCEPVDLGVVEDEPDALRAALADAVSRCDAIITSGGVSMGAFDYVKVVLDDVGDMRWMQIAIKPAKPFAFGMIGDVAVFGLPGNPVSSLVSFELMARAALGLMGGQPDTDLPLIAAISDDSLGHRPDGKTHFLRVDGEIGPDGRRRVRRSGAQGSHQLTAMARATALAVVPDGAEIEPGDPVDVLLLAGAH